MKEHYEGEEGTAGWRRRKDKFLEQELVIGLDNNEGVARKLANKATVIECQPGQSLYLKDHEATCMFFVLNGRIELTDDNKFVALLKEGQSLGEFPLIGESWGYAVTAIAKTTCVLAVVSYPHFEEIAAEYTKLWLRMARKLAARLNLQRQEDATREHVIVLVHGIRTFANWQPQLEEEF